MHLVNDSNDTFLIVNIWLTTHVKMSINDNSNFYRKINKLLLITQKKRMRQPKHNMLTNILVKQGNILTEDEDIN